MMSACKFEAGKQYSQRIYYDTPKKFLVAFSVERRSAQFLWLRILGDILKRQIFTLDGVEYINPAGKFNPDEPKVFADCEFYGEVQYDLYEREYKRLTLGRKNL